jgi:hypothetical protein
VVTLLEYGSDANCTSDYVGAAVPAYNVAVSGA